MYTAHNASIRGKMHKLDFEIVHTGQRPLLSGETCERLGLICFTIPEELNKVEQCRSASSAPTTTCSLTLLSLCPVIFIWSLDSTVSLVQCAPRNVPVALKAAVKAQLDRYEKEGHLTTVTQPTDWISNLVIVKRPDKLRL